VGFVLSMCWHGFVLGMCQDDFVLGTCWYGFILGACWVDFVRGAFGYILGCLRPRYVSVRVGLTLSSVCVEGWLRPRYLSGMALSSVRVGLTSSSVRVGTYWVDFVPGMCRYVSG